MFLIVFLRANLVLSDLILKIESIMEFSVKVLCLNVLVLSLFVCNMEARESKFFDDETAFENPIGGSKTTGYGESYTNRGVNNAYGAGSRNGYDSYRGQVNSNGYGSEYRSQSYGSGESGFGARSESKGADLSGYRGAYGTASRNRNGFEADPGFGNVEFDANNGFYKENP